MTCEWCFKKIEPNEKVVITKNAVFHKKQCYEDACDWVNSGNGKSIDSLWEAATD